MSEGAASGSQGVVLKMGFRFRWVLVLRSATRVHDAKYEFCMEYSRSMGFPTRACMELMSDEAMKQSLRLVKEVSLSMSWNTESFPGRGEREAETQPGVRHIV